MRDSAKGIYRRLIEFSLASFALILPSHTGAQDWLNRCMADPTGFSQEGHVNAATAQYLTDLHREIRLSDTLSSMSGMAGLGDRAMEARSRGSQYRQDLQKICAQISQFLIERQQRQQRADADRIAAAQAQQAATQASQAAERQRLAVTEYELNRRVPGATDVMLDAAFGKWLDSSQGKTLRRDVWDQAMVTENYDRAAQMLRDYMRTRKSK